MPLTVTVIAVNGSKFELEVESDDTVESLKLRIKEKDGTPPDQQRIINEGRELTDGHCLSDYNIQHRSIVYVTLRLRGGWLPEEELFNLHSDGK
uniref:Ubiquitin-like domain-containing protein n=1 Tax=Pundamilia nyererei TaxID=303518 RepID=A0A3B4ETV3_9CICH